MIETKCLPRAHETQVRAPRLRASTELFVESKTIGTDLTFRLKLENMSRSGMLLTWEGDVRVPFLENTIIEMRVDPNHTYLKTPVYCLGKVVRRSSFEPGVKPRFGIRIVQMDDDDLVVWEATVAELERRFLRTAKPTKFRLIDTPKFPSRRQPRAIAS